MVAQGTGFAMRVIKIFGIVIAVPVLFVTGIAIYASSLDLNQYKQLLSRGILEATGYEVTIAGDVELAVFPVLAVALNTVTVANGLGDTRSVLARIGRIESGIGLHQLLSGQVRVQRLTLVEPEVFLERDGDGRGNWRTGATGESASAGRTGVSISEVLVERGRLLYRGGVGGPATEIGVPMAEMHVEGLDGPAAMTLRLDYEGELIHGTVTLISLAGLLEDRPVDLSVALRVGGASVVARGRLRRPSTAEDFDLRVQFQSEDSRLLERLAGVELSEFVPIRGRATVRGSWDRMSISDLQASFPAGAVGGELSLLLDGPRPSVQGRLSSDGLDLDRVFPRVSALSGRAASSPDGRVIPSKSLPQLDLVDAKLSVALSRANYRGVRFDSARLDIELENGRLRLDPAQAAIAGGTVDATLLLTPTASGPALAAAFKGERVGLGAAFNQHRGVEVITGAPTDFHFELTGHGDTLRALAASLRGELQVEIGPARIANRQMDEIGADGIIRLRRMVNPFSAEDEFTELHCGVLRFDIEEGVARSDQGVGIETSKLNITAGGTIDLRTEALDFHFRPEPRSGATLGVGSLAGLVQIGGTLAAPAPEVSGKGALLGAASVGAALATGGLSLLAQGAFARSSIDQSPCASALGRQRDASEAKRPAFASGRRAEDETETPRAAPAAALQDGTHRSSSAPPPGEPDQEGSPIEALKSLGGKLKGLFGD